MHELLGVGGAAPVAGMVLFLGVDRFMSEARAITNTIGNAVRTLAIARWVGSLDRTRMQRVLDGAVDPEDLEALYEGDDVVVEFAGERKLAA